MPSPRCVHEQASIICFGLPCWGGLIPYRTRYNRNEHLERIAFKQLELKRAMHTPRYGKLQHSTLQNLFQIFCIFYRLGAINFCVDPMSNLLLLFCANYIGGHKFGIFVCLFVCLFVGGGGGGFLFHFTLCRKQLTWSLKALNVIIVSLLNKSGHISSHSRKIVIS